MNLQNAKRISRILISCLTALGILVLGGALLFTVGSALVWFLPALADKIDPYHVNIQVNGIQLLLCGKPFSIPSVSGACLLGALKMLALFLALFYSRQIFKRIRFEETPFQRIISKNIRMIGIFLFVYQFIWSWEDGIIQMLFTLIIPMILFCISFIFDYGCMLQKEVDETL